jgi:hypothetical protein
MTDAGTIPQRRETLTEMIRTEKISRPGPQRYDPPADSA